MSRRRPLALLLATALALQASASRPARAEPSPDAAPGEPLPPPETDAALTPAPSANPRPYEFQPGVICPLCKLTPQFPEGRSGLHWHDHWGVAGMRELITIPILGGAAAALELFVRPRARARWSGPILFDGPVRDLLRIGSPSGRRTAATLSDALFIWEIVHPSLVDPLLFAWWKRKAPFVAWQMLLIDAQAYSMTLLLNGLVKRLTARERPWVSVDDCERNPSGPECGSTSPYVSFYSGHASITATSAGLMCAHHTQLSLYESHLLDTGMCVLAVTGTALTGAMRIASDNHWTSDVLIGHLVGYTSGYLLPTLLYYKEFRTTPHEHAPEPTYTALPMITPNGVGVSVFGWF